MSHERFTQLYAENEHALYGFVYSLMPDRNAADDVIQAAMSQLWEHFDQYDPTRRFLPWACRFAYRQVLMHRRSESTRRRFFSETTIELLSADASQTADSDKELMTALHSCRQQLTDHQRELLAHRYDGDMPITELADQLGRNVAALYKSLERIRKSLADCISFMVGGFAIYHYMISVNHLAQSVASITHLENAKWEADASELSLGDAVAPGRLRLASGMLRLSYQHGVVLSLVGPADFQILSRERAVLHAGQLAAYVPAGAEGFRVDTPSAGVVDLGTEFGVTVDSRGETELSVFDGKVELTPSTPNAETQIVSSGHAMKVDRHGNAKPFQLAPYKEARDSLRGWQLVWEPFGPGSATGPFPGNSGAGWKGPWNIDIEHGHRNERVSGVFDERPLYPGAEFYLSLGAKPQDERAQVMTRATRDFGPIDQFKTNKPYTVELLVRVESTDETIEQFRVFSHPTSAKPDEPASWEVVARRDAPNEELRWAVASPNHADGVATTLPLESWKRFRCFVEIDPTQDVWRVTVAGFTKSISNAIADAVPLMGIASGEMTLGIEAIGKAGKPVRFSIDGIRIQNHPGVK